MQKGMFLSSAFLILLVQFKIRKGMILDPEELVSVSDFLRGCRKIKKFMLDKEFLHQY